MQRPAVCSKSVTVVQKDRSRFFFQRDIQRLILVISHHQQCMFLIFPIIRHQMFLLSVVRDQSAVYQSVLVIRMLAQGNQSFVEGENRILILFLSGDIDPVVNPACGESSHCTGVLALSRL